jgi:hypothetical protein
LASLGVSLEGRGSSQGDSVDLEPRHCVSEDTLSELDLAHASKCVLGRQQGPLVRGIVAREIMPTWERLWDDFVQEETTLISETSGQQQTLQGDEDLALWTKGKKKVSKGGRQGPKFGAPP